MLFEQHAGFGCPALRRYADVQAALRDPLGFPISLARDFDEAAHTRLLREAMDRALPPERLNAWKLALEAIPVEANIRELVTDFAEPWAHNAALRLFGLESDHNGQLRALARAVFAAGAQPRDATLQEPAAEATARLVALLPEPTLGPLTTQAFVAISQTLAAFLANAMAALLTHQIPLADAGTPQALEELLRFAGPAQVQFRYRRADGARIALLLAEANRDPDQFPDPNQLDLTRNAGGHLAFGAGPHACVGALLVRAAAPIALRHLPKLCGGALLDRVDWPEGELAIRGARSIHILRGCY